MAKRSAPRSIWTGSITFGLVTIPVRLFPAVREETIHFHMLHDQDHARLRRKLVCSADGSEIHPEHIVKGYEIAPDQYVVVRQEELEAVQPKKTRTIEIQDFVGLEEIDPVFYDRTYYVLPQEAGTKAYRLLVDAMEKSKRVGVARFVMHNKEYLAALRPVKGALTLDTMHFADEVLPIEDIDVPHKTKSDEREVKMAQQLIDSLSASFKPEKYHDEYREAVRAMIERKAAGEQVVTAPEPAEKPGRVTNLLEALQASLATARRQAGKGEDERSDTATATEEKTRTRKSHPGQTKRRKK